MSNARAAVSTGGEACSFCGKRTEAGEPISVQYIHKTSGRYHAYACTNRSCQRALDDLT